MYNPGSGFRNTWGVELSDYKSGLDASISQVSLKTLPDGKEAATGLSGVQDPLWNTVTNWALEQNSFTRTMHCTSDIDKAVYWNK